MIDKEHLVRVTREANKENLFKSRFADTFVEMLRAARSPGTPHHVPSAANALSGWLELLSLEPESSAIDVVEAAIARLGFAEEPTGPLDKRLVDVARAGISYLLAAAEVGRPGAGFLSKRTGEFIRAINEFKDFQAGYGKSRES